MREANPLCKVTTKVEDQGNYQLHKSEKLAEFIRTNTDRIGGTFIGRAIKREGGGYQLYSMGSEVEGEYDLSELVAKVEADLELRYGTPERSAWTFLDSLAADLSPENLCCDGELSAAQVNRRRRNILRLWKKQEKVLQRNVSEDDVWDRSA